MSAETGHHFANPTNHFWRCLYRSGLTSTLLPPSEDYSLPDRYNLGLTNIVDRPSIQAAELSKSELKASVPALLRKITRYKPRFVCFVGMGIWEVVRSSLTRMTLPPVSFTRVTRGSPSSKSNRPIRKEKSQLGLQSYKFVHAEKGGLTNETFFFVVPSTSGRVVKYQLSDKIECFTELWALLQESPSELSARSVLPITVKSQDL